MIRNIKIEKAVDIQTADCWIYARSWEDSEINGVADDAENPHMPGVTKLLGEKAWHIIINLDTGQICNWPHGITASIHYKSCDGNYIRLLDEESEEVKEYQGYVPRFLCPKEGSYGDYVIMDIDENGYIKDFDNNLDDIFDED